MTEERNDEQTAAAAARSQASAEATAEANGVSSSPPGEDTIESLRERLNAALAEKEENLRGWQRAQADYANFRRRVEQEREDLVKGAEAGLLLRLLPVLDDLERALAGLPPELHGVTWVDGVLLIERKLRSVLEAHGLTPIEAMGQPFDPNLHEAVMRDDESGEATTVTGELQRGYRLHDRVLRPTLVKVGPTPQTEKR
jgi:molecular chaperone GrpE